MQQEMTHGNPTKLIVKFSIPLLLTNIFQQLYNLTDIIIVGHLLGVGALAAVGSSAPIFFVLLLITLGFTGGLTVITAQSFGARNYRDVRRSVTHSLIAGLILSIVLTIIMVLYLRPVLVWMNVPSEIMGEAYKFMIILSYGLSMIVAYNLLSGFIRALGDSKTPLYFLIFSSILNIILNVIFIYYFKMGVAGSALGTFIAITISVFCCIVYIGKKFPIMRLQKADWKLEWSFMKKHLHIAVPMALQFSVLALSLIIVQRVCNTFGTDTIAAFTAALRFEQLATQPMVALGIAMATYAAQNYGAGMIGRIRRGVYLTSIVSLCISVFIALLVRFAGGEMISVITDNANENIINTGKTYLNISTLFYFFLGQIFIFRNTLQGMGQSFIPLMAGFAELFMRSFAAIYLADRIGYVGICYASPIAWIGASSVVAIGYMITIRRINSHYFKNRLKQLRQKLHLNKHKEILLPEYSPAE